MATDPTRPGAGPAGTTGAGLTERFGGGGRRLSTETRRAPTTTEFFAYIAVTIAVLIAALVIKGDDGDADNFTATTAWLYVVILTVGYMLSRGWAKSGGHERYDEDR